MEGLHRNEKDPSTEHFKEVDLFSTFFEKGLLDYGQVYERKIQPIVAAREVHTPELVVTKTNNGLTETTTSAEVGDLVVTGSQGEVYVQKRANVAALYDMPTDGSYVAKQRKIRVLKNPYGLPIKVIAPWSTEDNAQYQYGTEDCYISISLDAEGELTDDRYIIGGQEYLLGNYTPE